MLLWANFLNQARLKKKKAKVLEERLLDVPYEEDEQPRKDEEKNDE